MNSFPDRLAAQIKKLGNAVLVGLDPRLESLPESFKIHLSPSDWVGIAKSYAAFCRDVIDVVAPLVPAVKPQAAFFEQVGPPGMEALAEIIRYARQKDCWWFLTANAMTSARRLPLTLEAYWAPDRLQDRIPMCPTWKKVPGGPMRLQSAPIWGTTACCRLLKRHKTVPRASSCW